MATQPLDSAALRKRDAWAARTGVDTYVQEMGAYALRRDREIVQAMIGRGPGVLLDLPCGTGRFLELERASGYQVVAADYSSTMLAAARCHEDVQFVRADVFDPPFEPETFDVMVVLRLLFHYAECERIIASLLPALKPAGRLIFDTLNPGSTRWMASVVLHQLRPDPARRLHFERPGRLQQSLARMGLKVLQRTGAYILPTRLYRHLPRWTWRLADAIEPAVPPSLRVLSYWHVTRRGGRRAACRP